MKKLFTFFAAALFTITAGAANGDVTDGWLMVEDFENEPTLSLYNKNGQTPTGTMSVVDSPTEAGNKVVSFADGDYNTAIEFDVKLPDGKTLSDYTQVAFDLYIVSQEENQYFNCKNMLVQVDDNVINLEDNSPKQAEYEEWTQKSYNLNSVQAVGNTFKLRLGLLINSGQYYIDNVRFRERPEPGATNNGQIVDGWLMLQDFEAASLGDDFRIWNRWGKDLSDIYEVSLVDNPDGGKAAKITYPDEGQGEYDTMFELDVILPDGKALTDYSDIAFDLYRLEGDHTGTQMYIDVNGVLIYLDSGYPNYEDADGKWYTWTCELEPMPNGDEPAGSIDGITGGFKLHLGLKSPGPNYMIDNVRLKPTTATGITDVQAGAETVVVVDGGVMINAGAKAAYAVYDISGRAVSQGVADGSKTVTLQRGVYVVRVNGKAVKVLVR